MGVRTKGRRKIVVDGQEYVWYVAENYDGPGNVLHLASHDKKLAVMYPIYDEIKQQYIVILGERFAGAETGGTWKRFVCPEFDSEGIVTPKHVRELILWCMDPEEERGRVESVWSWPL